MSGGHSNNISWGLPISDFASTVNSINAPQSGQTTTSITNSNFHSITTNPIHSQTNIGTSNNLLLFDKGKSPITNAKIQLNGHDRFSIRDNKYFNIIQPYQHHTSIPCIGINCYSFCLYPENHQPSGSCNFSSVDSANLIFNLTEQSVINQRKCHIRIYATNYNILNISQGIGKLTYSK